MNTPENSYGFDELKKLEKELQDLDNEINRKIKLREIKIAYYKDYKRFVSEDQLVKAASDSTLIDTPGYPYKGSLLEKIKFIEADNYKLWLKKDMKEAILKIEGPGKTLKYWDQDVPKLVTTGQLIKVIFQKGYSNTYFTSNRNFFEKNNKGEHILKKEYWPANISDSIQYDDLEFHGLVMD